MLMGDIVHSGVTIGGRTVEQLVNAFIQTWYENFQLTCDLLAGHHDPPPGALFALGGKKSFRP